MKCHLIAMLSVVAGCAVMEDPESSNQPESATSFEQGPLGVTAQNRDAVTSSLAGDRMIPTVTIALKNGNTVEIYNLHKAALVMERGEAYTAPAVAAFGGSMRADHLVELFQSLRPDLAVPAELIALQRELTTSQGPAPAQAAAPAPAAIAPALLQPILQAPGGVSGGSQVAHSQDGNGAQPNSLIGCDNGCCDPDWTANTLCSGYSGVNGYDYTWYLFNYGWSYANGSNDWFYGGTVCSATGTSTYQVSVGDGSGGTWSVLQQHYIQWWWAAGTDFWGDWIRESVSSSVNSSSAQHLHMYCGGFAFH